jgi:cell division protein FtsQ
MSSRYTPHMRPRPEADTSVVVPLDVRLMHAAASSLLVGLLVAGLVTGVWALTRLPIFVLAGITVLGDVEHNNAVTLRANVVTRLNGNFFTTDLDRVQAAFQAVPWVRSASVAREFPNRLRVTLQEHTPVAYWGDDGESRMVNTYGEVFEANVGEVEDDKMPRLRGPDSQSQQVLAMYSALKPVFAGLNLPLESLELTGRGSWRGQQVG